MVGVSLTQQSKRAVISRLDSDADFRDAWTKNMSGEYYKDMWERLDIDAPIPRNETSRYYGTPSGGKSITSLFVVYLQREFFDFQYVNLFSQMDASIWLVKKAYEALKENKKVRRFTLNIDEDRKMFGAGSAQEEAFFDGFIEFLRQAQINVHVLNPNDISDIDTQFECIGYTAEGYEKSIVYQKIDRRTNRYKAQGYVVTKQPPKNYVDAYKLQKEDFLNNFIGNRSGRNVKDDTILDLIWNDMHYSTKQMIGNAILLNKDRDVKHLIYRDLQVFNLPVRYTDKLVESFRWKYFEKEIQQTYENQRDRLQNKINRAKPSLEYMRKSYPVAESNDSKEEFNKQDGLNVLKLMDKSKSKKATK